MMHNKTLILVALVPAAGFAVYAWQARSVLPLPEEVTRADGSTQPVHVIGTSAAEPTSTRSVEALVASHAAPTKATFADVYAAAENNLEFIRQIHADALDGDAEAQYQLFSALEYCERYYLFYFVRGSSRKTLDQALAWAARSPGTDVAEAREVHRRCQDLMEDHANEFGRSDDWLGHAAEGGHPEAQLARAERLLMAPRRPDDDLRASDAHDQKELRTEAKEFLLKGLERKDPSAVWKIGDLQDPLTGHPEKAEKDQWIWRLAACKLGYDCSQTADWYQFMCRFDYNCQPHESGVDLILRASAVTLPDVNLLSDELVEKINKGDLSGLGWK